MQPPAGVEARIIALIAPVCEEAGFRLVRVRLLGLNGLTLQIMAERGNGTMTVEDCEQLSRDISPLLDAENVIDQHYNLEISSPGIDRPLMRKSDFAAWCGHLAKIAMQNPVAGQKKFRGIIMAAEGDYLTLCYEAEAAGEVTINLPFADIAEASLVLTEALIRAVLQQGKQKARQSDAGRTLKA
ncbi:MAG: ribosome maturation factor RimP [Candidatus Tokpelaia sp.]|nr:MAG: ribosome maturation factor RimP [Candidatus Tokpelaia sp.]KAA6205351.1 MAG: ribosome maturation factor RimP [Candidatus Tokpelaia sp.]KAA6405463.1 ribosome maturation factor RimP [Candidatus Tokpelaia sp.]